MVFLAALWDLRREGWSRGLPRLGSSSPLNLAENEVGAEGKSTKHCASIGGVLGQAW